MFPFAVFNFQKLWVGTAWLEDVLFFFFMYGLTIINLKNSGHKIIFLSGRDEAFRQVTHDWLITNIIPDGDFELHMRAADDRRKDAIIKKEIYNNHIRNRYNILGWFDDRIQVLDMVQKELGIFTFDLRQDCRGINDY